MCRCTSYWQQKVQVPPCVLCLLQQFMLFSALKYIFSLRSKNKLFPVTAVHFLFRSSENLVSHQDYITLLILTSLYWWYCREKTRVLVMTICCVKILSFASLECPVWLRKITGKKLKRRRLFFNNCFKAAGCSLSPGNPHFCTVFVYIPIIPLFAAEFVMKMSVEPTELASHEMAIRLFLDHFIGPNCSK